jgi:hypothetical protein
MGLGDFHAFQDGVSWRVTPRGVEIQDSGVERSAGQPITATRVWDRYGQAVNAAAKAYRVPAELIVATVCTESAGKADAVREEPGYTSDEATPNRVSIGLTQTLLSTAREAMQMSFDRNWLLDPANAIEAGTAYIGQQSRLTSLDPPLVAAAYNAGALKYQNGSQNRWKLRQYPIGTGAHLDRFVRFFNDAVVVLGASSTRPDVSLADLLGAGVRPRTSPPEQSVKDPTVRFGTNARADVVTPYALGVLKDVMRASGTRDVLISSTQRTPRDQARVMFDNCRKYGPDQQKGLYASAGDKVIDVYVASTAAGRSADQVKADMEAKIVDLGPTNVSRHTADPRVLAVIDVAPSSLPDMGTFERAVKADSRISQYFMPPKDPGFHLEIPQPR